MISSLPLSFRGWVLFLLLVTVLLYSPVADYDFVNWDDDYYILRDKTILAGWTPQGVRYALTATHPYIMPLPRLVFMSLVEFFGLFPGAFHLVNLLFHLANIALLAVLLRLWCKSSGLALVMAALFALHPQRVEAVAWITELKEVMAAFFGLLALLCYHVFVRQGNPAYRLLALMAMLFSLLCKPSWVVLPGLLLLLDVWPWQRLGQGWLPLVGEKWPFFLLALLFALMTVFGMASTSQVISLDDFSLSHRLGNALTALGRYFLDAFWPFHTALYNPRPVDPWGWHAWLGGSLVVGLTGLGWMLRRHHPFLLIGWFWFLGVLLPVVGMVTGGIQVVVSDRWTYVSHMGLLLALIPSLTLIVSRHVSQAGLGRLAGLVLVVMALASQQALAHWQNSITLWSHAMQRLGEEKGNDYPHAMLGKYYAGQERYELAIPLFQRAREVNPHFPFYVLELANAHLQLRHIQEAWQEYNHFATMPLAPPAVLLEVGRLGLLNGQQDHLMNYWPLLQARIPQEAPEQLVDLQFYIGLTRLARGEVVDAGLLLAEYLTVADRQRCEHAMPLVFKWLDVEAGNAILGKCLEVSARGP